MATIAVSGSSGLVGSKLARVLSDQGDTVLRLTRNSQKGSASDLFWDPEEGLVNPQRLSGVDAVIHLAGENIAEGRWNSVKKGRIRSSRVDGTRRLSEQIARCENPPKVMVCASAIGFYGDRGDEILTESSLPGEGFLSDLCQEWESATSPARQAGIRVVNVRIGVVLASHGGALAKMLTPFRLGLGGVIGDGSQYWSWISLEDLVRVLIWVMEHDSIEGTVNAVAPESVTNREFTKTLGQVLSRPTVFPLPGFVAGIVLGEMAEHLLLASTRVSPVNLVQSGFAFEHHGLRDALEHALSS